MLVKHTQRKHEIMSVAQVCVLTLVSVTLQSPARLHQLSASPNPKVEWGSLVSSSRLRKLPDTTATDASQSIFVPVGSGVQAECTQWHTRMHTVVISCANAAGHDS